MKIDQFFQKGYYINLDRRTDRNQQFEEEVSKVGLSHFFERVSGHDAINEPDPMKKHYYCGSSYMRLFNKIYEEGYERVLIFEDDIMFYNGGAKSAIEIIEDALDEIQNFPDWDMLFLGGHPIGEMAQVSENLSIPYKILAMHATGYTRNGIQKILPYKPFADSAIDGWVSARPYIKKYIVNSLAVSQTDGISDLDATGKSVGLGGFLDSYNKVKRTIAMQPKKQQMVLSKNYITPRLQGRTGNIMFQIAHAYVKSLEHNRQFVVPSEESSTKHLEKGLFRKFDFRIEKIPDAAEAKHIWGPFTFGNYPAPADDQPTVYAGWYQSEKFFGKYKEVIRDVFSPPHEFIKKALTDFPVLTNSVVAVINIRRGDYLTQPRRHPVVTLPYIQEAIKRLPKHDVILVVSDDIAWCKENIKESNIVFAEKYFDQEALWLLSLCDHYIISNSTFSWWGAYLSRNPNKVVVSPSTWFGPDVAENPQDIWCDGWIKIDTKWEDGYIVLK